MREASLDSKYRTASVTRLCGSLRISAVLCVGIASTQRYAEGLLIRRFADGFEDVDFAPRE
jgi:hypothetical protein